VANPAKAFIDTNLLLRYLIQDDASQTLAVRRLLDRAALGEVSLVIAPIVLAEITWVLESRFSLSPDTVSEYLEAVLHTPGLEVQEAGILLEAVRTYRNARIDFVDAWIATLAKASGVRRVYTFDRRHFARVPGIEVLAP